MSKLKEMRKAFGLTQCKLASLIGVNGSLICLYEKGYRKPNIETLKKLAKVFSCTIDELINTEEDSK